MIINILRVYISIYYAATEKAFAGFGLQLCRNSNITHYLKWKKWNRNQPTNYCY